MKSVGYSAAMNRALLALLVLIPLAGCASLVRNASDSFARNLGTAVLNSEDPATVRDGLPAYLLLLDSLVAGQKPGDPLSVPAISQGVFKTYVEKQVEEINKGLARYESIKKVALLAKELSVETGELTPTLKLKRRVILERHKDAIDALYAQGA